MRLKIKILLLALVTIYATGCTKDVYKMAEDTGKEIQGTYKFTEMYVEDYDSMGNSVSSNSYPQTAIASFYYMDVNDIFNTFRVEGNIDALHFLGYFHNEDGLEEFTDGRLGCYYQVDPYKKRINFWCIAPLSNYHYMVNYELKGNTLILKYTFYDYYTKVRKFITSTFIRQ